MSTDGLECDNVIYHHSYFVFDPEDVERNFGFFHYLIPNAEQIEVVNYEGTRVEVASASLVDLLDPVFWSCLVVIVTLTLISMTCCCQCCLVHFCARQKYKTHSDWETAKICCGGLSWALTAVIIACSAVVIWSEFNMDAGVQANWNNTLAFVSETVPGNGFVTIIHRAMQFFYDMQHYRMWVSFVVNIITVLLMLTAMIVICLCTPFLKSVTPIIVMLILNGFWTFFMSLITAVTFFSLFYVSFLCYDLYRIGGNARCGDENLLPFSLSLQNFCGTDVFVPHLVIVSVLFGALVFMTTWQIISAFYASVFSGKADRSHTSLRQQRQAQKDHDLSAFPASTNLDYSQLQERIESQQRRLSSQQSPFSDQQGRTQIHPFIAPRYHLPYPNTYEPDYQSATDTADMTMDDMDADPSAPPRYDECWNESVAL